MSEDPLGECPTQPGHDVPVDVTSLRQKLFFSTVHIRAGNATAEWTGTGFFYGDTHVAIVTNRHVLEGGRRGGALPPPPDWFEFTALRRAPNGAGPMLGQGLKVRVSGPGVGTWLRHPDANIDVAVFPCAELFGRWVEMSGQQPYYHAVTPANFADLGSLDAIEDVTFVGYPNGFYDTTNLTPLARHGRTATPPELDYEGRPMYLIDAPVFAGSSGSPVFIVRDSLSPNLAGSMVLDSPRVLFVGVVAAVKVRPQVLEVVDPAQQKLIGSTVLSQELGLGIVFKPQTILEIYAEAERQGRD